MKLLIINGVNLGLLGTREVNVYGHVTFEEYLASLRQQFPSVQLDFFQHKRLRRQSHGKQNALRPGPGACDQGESNHILT